MLCGSVKYAGKASGLLRRIGVTLPSCLVVLRHRSDMFRIRSIGLLCAVVGCAALMGCGGVNQFTSQPGGGGNASVVLAMTDTPPSTVSVLSAEVTLTGATLAPGNVSLFSGSAPVELTKLQTDIAYIATASNVSSGNYTSVTLTFANPSITFENDTASTLAGCAVGAICTIVPTATSMSATVPLTAFSVASESTTGLLIDVSLDSLLTASLGADFSAGTTVTSFSPGGSGAPLVGAEDVVGHVGNVNTSANTFTLTNAQATYSLKVNNTSAFFQFPSSPCAIACLLNNQIVSVDIGMQSDGSILARNIVFEDADSSDAEIEGVVTGTNLGSQQFDLVVLGASTAGTGLTVGHRVTAQYSVSPQTPFDVDFAHADSVQLSTSGFLFTAPADLVVGQQVSIRRHSTLSGGQILADRVRLRSSRVTAAVQTIGSGIITISSLPSIFSGHGGVTQIQAQTFPPTIFFEIGRAINISDIGLSNVVSVRGPLFNTGGTNRTVVTTKVVLK
jgi:hypothetical protein